MNKLGFVLAAFLLIGLINCGKKDAFFVEGEEVIEVDPCDVQIAMNLKYLKLTNSHEQLSLENGAQFIRLNFDFDFNAPSSLTRQCFDKGVKALYFFDRLGKVHLIDSSKYAQTEKGLQLDIPLNLIQSLAQQVEDYSNGQQVGFLNKLKLLLEVGNTRVALRKYTINYQIFELMDGSIEFSQPLVVFQNSGSK